MTARDVFKNYLYKETQRKSPPENRRAFKPEEGSHRAGDLTGTEASGADVHVGRSAIHERLNPLDIGLPGAVGAAVGVGNLDAENDVLVAEFTFGHVAYLLAMTKYTETGIRRRVAFDEASNDILADLEPNCKCFF